MAYSYYRAHHRAYSLASSDEYFLLDSGELRSSRSSPPTSGDYAETPLTDCMDRWYVFMSFLTPSERRTNIETGIRMWRETQIFTAVEGAFAGLTQSDYDEHGSPISDETWEAMMNGRPRPGLWPHFNNMSEVPSDYTGPFRVRGAWYHES